MPIPGIQLRVRATGRHPWFYRKMVRKPEAPLPAGSAVAVVDRDGRRVGTGFYNPRTELALRILTGETLPDEEAVQRLLLARLDRALELRNEVLQLPAVTDAYRIVHAEGDGLPGLVLDRFADVYVAQPGALAIAERLEPLGRRLQQRHPGCRLLLLQDAEAARREGMERLSPPRPLSVEVTEHGLRYLVRAGGGHKTGFFADQRDHRLRLRHLARGRRVLDLCCHAGGFALNAARGGARSVCAVDLDEHAVAEARENAARNRLRVEVVHADAFDVLRRAEPGQHDLIVLDPPKWAGQRSEVEDALRRYRDLNRLAFEKLAGGGLLVTCSCSGPLSEERFLKALREAAAQAARDAAILCLGGAGPDHPVALHCPETRYLKVAFLRVE